MQDIIIRFETSENKLKDIIIRFGDYDGAFKVASIKFFEKYGYHVDVDPELAAAPKKVDIVVIKSDNVKPTTFKLFNYFKDFNIIEFKSEKDTFRMKDDLFMMPNYISGYLLTTKNANYENTTFTLISSRTPLKLLKYYEKYTKKVQNGVYCIGNTGLLKDFDSFIICIDELDLSYEKEVAYLKEFSFGNDKEKYLQGLIRRIKSGENEYLEYFRLVSCITEKDTLFKILKMEDFDMTMVEKNLTEWMDEFGLKEKFKHEGKAEGIAEGKAEGIAEGKIEDAKRMLEEGLDIKLINRVTGLSIQEIESLKE